MRDSAARELITATPAARERSVATPRPAVADGPHSFEGNGAVGPLMVLVSLLGHGAVLAIFALLPAPPVHVDSPTERSAIIPFEPEAVVEPPAPASEPEPVIEPPEPVRAAVVAPRPRPRREPTREEPPEPAPEPAAEPTPAPPPPAEIMTAGSAGSGEWSHTAGEPGGQLGGVPGGRGTQPVPTPVVGAASAQPSISRAELRRILARYITGTLSSYLDGRIDYPLAARREQLQGVVMLRIRLARDGRLLAVRLSRSSGHSMLDRAALASVQGLGSMPAPPREIPWDDTQELPLPVTYELQ